MLSCSAALLPDLPEWRVERTVVVDVDGHLVGVAGIGENDLFSRDPALGLLRLRERSFDGRLAGPEGERKGRGAGGAAVTSLELPGTAGEAGFL